MKNIIKEKFNHLKDANGYSIMHHINRNPEIISFLKEELTKFPEFSNLTNLVRCIINDIEYSDFPKCKTCGKTLKCLLLNKSNNEYCSYKCRSNNDTVKNKTINTNIEKYGAVNVWASDIIKKQISKKCIEKYGVDHIGKHKESHIKQKETMLNKHGVLNMICKEEIRSKIKINQVKKAYENMQRYKDIIPDFTEEEFINNRLYDKKFEYNWKCTKCGNIFKQVFFKNCKFPRCYVCDPLLSQVSKCETLIFNYIKSLNLDCKSSDRSIINPLELDIVIPSKKLAIEFNGNYWHTESKGKDEFYHINKTNKCKEIGYRLIHIFEDEWIYKEKIVKSRLRAILGLTKFSIGARKCEIKEISSKIKDTFLEKYHIQGKDKSSIRLGLFYKNRLVAVMTFGNRRFDDKEGYELIRYATISNFNIIGGAGKLLSYFRNNFNKENLPIISYADKRWSEGNVYKKLGFKLIRETKPNYWYINKENDLIRLSRHQFMKHKLKDKLEKFDENLSEVENMKYNGYDRIFDCGNLVFELS